MAAEAFEDRVARLEEWLPSSRLTAEELLARAERMHAAGRDDLAKIDLRLAKLRRVLDDWEGRLDG